MITFQDLIEVGDSDKARIEFVFSTIGKHKATKCYRDSVTADAYDRRQNVTICTYQKLLYTLSGKAVPDNYSANYKLCSNFFDRFITQQVQYLLGNGVSWTDDGKPSKGKNHKGKYDDKLGKDFDNKLQNAAHEALVSGVAFGFWNLDHLDVFNLREFVPLYDEEDGSLKAGIRFWQVDPDKPMRATLFEMDGYTDFIQRKGEDAQILNEKRKYILNLRSTEADGTEIYNGENYPGFPIVPFYANASHQSELVGRREQIDCYDLIKSGFASDLDDFSQIFWIIQNGGGMDDIDLAKFVERMKTVKAAVVEDGGATAEAHTMEVPYASREALLDRLRADLYEDFMALDTKNIANGAVTATQIQAAYEPLLEKTDKFEFFVISFIQGILALIGIEDSPSFTRSTIVNRSEEIQVLLQASTALDADYITTKILEYLGDGDKAEEMLKKMDEGEMQRFAEEE